MTIALSWNQHLHVSSISYLLLPIHYFTYILRCADDTLYTGITTDLARRLIEHNQDDKKGAKYTKNRRPVELVYHKKYLTRSEASKREYEIKQLSRTEKLELITKTLLTEDCSA